MMKKTTRNYVWALVANGLLLTAVLAVWEFRLHAASPEQSSPLPKASYLAKLDHRASLADLKGHWTLLNFWATWCPGCIVEMPSLEILQKDYKDKGLRVIAISMDQQMDLPKLKAALVRLKFGDVAANWDDRQEIFDAFNPEGLPMTYLIDPKGQIRASFSGEHDWSAVDLRSMLDDRMSEKD